MDGMKGKGPSLPREKLGLHKLSLGAAADGESFKPSLKICLLSNGTDGLRFERIIIRQFILAGKVVTLLQ